jgi:hypothetical protein
MRRLLSLSHASAAVHPREGNQEPKSLVVDVITYHASNQGLGQGQCRLWFATNLIMIVLHLRCLNYTGLQKVAYNPLGQIYGFEDKS